MTKINSIGSSLKASSWHTMMNYLSFVTGVRMIAEKLSMIAKDVKNVPFNVL